MKNKNGVRYLDFISSVFSVKGGKVQGRGGRALVMEEYMRQEDRHREREERVKLFHRLYSEINGQGKEFRRGT